MKSFLIIGMGKFGQTISEMMMQFGDEVMIVDKNEDIVNELSHKYSNAMIANCTNIDNLQSLHIASFDACVVAIGDDFQSSLEITSLLKELGAKYVVSKATTEIQKKFLLKNGADEVIYPDLDIAEKIAIKLNSEKIYDYIELDPNFSIFELSVPKEWQNKSLLEIDSRKKYGMNILMIKQNQQDVILPNANYILHKDDHMVIFGNAKEILNFVNKKYK